MSEIQTSVVSCSGRPAVVEVVGEGREIVMVGAAVPMAWTRPAAMSLARLGYRVVNFDYGSDHPDPEPRTCLDQVDDVLAVMDATGTSSAVLIGASRGAITAYGLAATRPLRVEGLVLAFPVAGFADTIGATEPDPVPEPHEPEEVFMRRSLGHIFSERFLDDRLENAISLVTTPLGSVCRVDRSEEAPFEDDWSVDCDVVVIEGGDDRVVGPNHPARYLHAAPNATHIVVPEASHGWLMEEPADFADLVDRGL